jgi:nucleotide-binding universal stress UspA family protein
MSKLTTDVLNLWVGEFVRPVPAAAVRREAERLAAEFTAYARDAGIDPKRLEEEVGSDLVSHMRDAIETARDAAAADDASR